MASSRGPSRRGDARVGAAETPPPRVPALLGRETECWVLAAALRGGRRAWKVLNVHGPSGLGKTALLHAFRAMAHEAGGRALYFDGQRPGLDRTAICRRLLTELGGPNAADVGRDALEAAAISALRGVPGPEPLVLVFDRYEVLAGDDRWIRGLLLEALPPCATVIVATCAPLRGAWRDTEALRALVRPMPLHHFDLQQTRQYLVERGVRDQDRAEHVWRWSHGHPGALSLAMVRAARDGPEALADVDRDPDIVAELAARWLEESPEEGRRLVEAAALCDSFDEESLEAALGERLRPGGFSALCALSYVHAASAGWSIDPLPRRILAEGFRRRAPVLAARIGARAAAHLAAVVAQPGDDRLRQNALRRLVYLGRGGTPRVEALYRAADTGAARHWRVGAAGPADVADIAAGITAWSGSWAGRGESSVAFGAGGEGGEPAPSGFAVGELRELVGSGRHRVRVLRDRQGRALGCSLVAAVDQPAGIRPAAARQAGRVPAGPGGTPRVGEVAIGDRPARLVCWVAADISTGTAGLAALVLELLALCLESDAGDILVDPRSGEDEELLSALGLQCLPSPSVRPTYRWGSEDACWEGMDGPASARIAPGPAVDGRHVAAEADGVSEPGRDRVVWLEGCGLTAREMEIAEALPEGLSNADIAYRLSISEMTVKKHLTQIFRKTDVVSRTQLVSKMLGGR